MSWLKEFVSRFNTEMIVFFIFGFSIISLFIPEDMAKRFNLFDLIEKYKSYLAVGLILSLLYYIHKSFKFLEDKVKSYSHKRIIKTHVAKNLNNEEKCLIIASFYNFEEKEFNSKAQLSINDGTVAILLQKSILYQPSNLSLSYLVCSLTLNNVVRLHLNYLVSIEKIVIKGNSQSFEYKW